jgi:hypothetical protein
VSIPSKNRPEQEEGYQLVRNSARRISQTIVLGFILAARENYNFNVIPEKLIKNTCQQIVDKKRGPA